MIVIGFIFDCSFIIELIDIDIDLLTLLVSFRELRLKISLIHNKPGIYILAIPPPGGFLSKVKNREELEGGLKKGKEKGGKGEKKKKRVIKHTLMNEIAGQNIYPCNKHKKKLYSCLLVGLRRI